MDTSPETSPIHEKFLTFCTLSIWESLDSLAFGDTYFYSLVPDGLRCLCP